MTATDMLALKKPNQNTQEVKNLCFLISTRPNNVQMKNVCVYRNQTSEWVTSKHKTTTPQGKLEMHAM